MQQRCPVSDRAVQVGRDEHLVVEAEQRVVERAGVQAQLDPVAVGQGLLEVVQRGPHSGDQAAVQAKTTVVAQLLSQSLEMRVASLQEISPILTPEQRAKFAQMGPGSFRHRGGHHSQVPSQGS